MSNIILPDIENIPLDVIASMLNVDIEDLYDLTIEQISDLTIKAAEEKSKNQNEVIEKRTTAHDTVRTAQKQAGITDEDLSYIYFEDIKGDNI
jgi:predicted transcriptional regulator